jgi:hypothetical protein
VAKWRLIAGAGATLGVLPWLTFAGVVFFAAITGLALVVLPGSTSRFFSWGVAPPPLASLIGGLYLGSAVAFAIGLFGTWEQGRGLAIASLAFTVPTFVATLAHLEVFDLSRLLAWAWIVVFGVAPFVFVAMLLAEGWRPEARIAAHRPLWARVMLGVLAAAFLAGATSLWWDPVAVGSRLLPFEPAPLGVRFLGSWMATVAVLWAWAAVRPPRDGRVALAGAAMFLLGALVGAARTYGQLEPGSRVAFLLVLAILAGISLLAGVPATRPAAASSVA